MKQTFSKVPFKEHQIWVGKDADGAVVLINLHNLCKILLRKDMIENGEALKICPSGARYPLYDNGKLFWFINTYDIHALLRSVRKENKVIAKVCDELAAWVATLPVGRATQPEAIAAEKKTDPPGEEQNDGNPGHVKDESRQGLSNGPVIFNFKDQPVCFKSENGRTYVNATQMGRIYGKKPREWLLLAETVDLRQSLVKKGTYENLESQIITSRGSTGVTWIEEQLGLEFTKWLSADIHKWYKSVIRQWGAKGYVTLNKEEGEHNGNRLQKKEEKHNFPVPKTFSEALILAGKLQELVELRDKQIEEDKPKVDFYNDFIENRQWFRTAIIADELRLSTVALNRFLYENKICRYDVKYKQWVCTGPLANLQVPVPYLWTNKNGKTYSFGKVMRWTPAGREYVLELYCII